MQWLAPARGTVKCLFGLPLRQTLGLVQSLLKMAGLPWAAPDYSTVCRRQKGINVQVHYRPSGNGLHMLADFTGIKFLGEGKWKTKKHGADPVVLKGMKEATDLLSQSGFKVSSVDFDVRRASEGGAFFYMLGCRTDVHTVPQAAREQLDPALLEFTSRRKTSRLKTP